MGGFCPNRRVKENEADHFRRKEELLAKLVERAAACPGLYPVRTRDDFLRLALDHGKGGVESLCQVLESMWHRPDEALQMNAQSLIRRGQGWGGEAEERNRRDQGGR